MCTSFLMIWYSSEKLSKSKPSCFCSISDLHVCNSIVASGYISVFESIMPLTINPFFVVFGAIAFRKKLGQQQQWSMMAFCAGSLIFSIPFALRRSKVSSRKPFTPKLCGKFIAVVVLFFCLHIGKLLTNIYQLSDNWCTASMFACKHFNFFLFLIFIYNRYQGGTMTVLVSNKQQLLGCG